MSLLTISDLDQPSAIINGYIEKVHKLGEVYKQHIVDSQDDTYEYPVKIFGGKTRAAGIHASEVSSCLRQVVYSLSGTERISNTTSVDSNMLMRFRIGHAVHAMLQFDWHQIAAKSGGRIAFEDELPVKPELQPVSALWNLHSSCDGVLTLMDENGAPEIRVGMEIKTKSDKMYEKMRQPDGPHMEQTTIYQAALDLPLMWVFYYNKSSSNFTECRAPNLFKFNKHLWENELEKRFVLAHHYAESGEPGPATEGLHCKWCPFGHACQPKILQRFKRGATMSPATRSAHTRRRWRRR